MAQREFMIEPPEEKITLYLSGPMKEVADSGEGWRSRIEEQYSDFFYFINPYDNANPEEDNIIYNPDHYDPETDEEALLPWMYVNDDKDMIDASDAVFVGLQNVISRGTSMEMLFAHDISRIPCYTWVQDGQEESGWIYHHSDFVSEYEVRVFEQIVNDFYA